MSGIPASWDSCTASVGHTSSNNNAVWSPCGQFIAAAFFDEIQIHDSNTLEKISTLACPDDDPIPKFLTFSPDGHLLACSFIQYDWSKRSRIPLSYPLVIWDIQTGVIIWKVNTQYPGRIMFHGNKKAITLIGKNGHIHTYNVLNGAPLHMGDIPLSLGSQSSTHWVHGDTLQFAVSLNAIIRHVIIIKEFQPTSTPPLHILSSFPIPPWDGKFSFSQNSFHASFVTRTEAIVLDVQDSKVLLHAQVVCESQKILGQLSPNGCFFAHGISVNGICIWQNTPTGYIPWSSLRPRLQVDKLLFSPTTMSILCCGPMGIQLLHPGSHPNPVSATEVYPHHKYQNHLVTYSADQVYVATVQRCGCIVTVLNSLLGTKQQLINPGMEIEVIKIIESTLFVVDRQNFVCWDLKAGGMVDGTHNARRVVDKLLAIDPHAICLTLTHDCSQIAFAMGQTVFLHNLKAPELITQYVSASNIRDLWFSPDQHSLLFTIDNKGEFYELMKMAIMECGSFGDVAAQHPKRVTLQQRYPSSSSNDFHIVGGWGVNSGGKGFLWLPPNWRPEYVNHVEWSGNLLALLSGNLPEPIIIQFYP